MKRFAIVIASFTVGLGAMFGVASVAASVAPAAVEVAKAPITTSDECMCGSGGLIFIGGCIFVPGMGARQWVYNPATGQQYTIDCTGN